MSNSPQPERTDAPSVAVTPSASVELAQGGALSVHDLPSGGGGTAWDDRTLAIATHFGYEGDDVPKQWLCAWSQAE